ncbi:MFS transporter [Lysobacter sp. A6]|uniref:MFS transporter n=1 Tax=Noviluteimonas lactosilytica TaxID=2888523 RepID=A0ABS8JI88_9GAMM|nr:MFS transporter [Lysobacter lactosilyticus]MCC8363277.1 MFS transporter [Lysobacter lactosilyticus]
MRAALASLPRTVWLLGAISLLNDAASDMIYPLVPLYVASVLMAGPKALGWIEGVAEAASSLLKLVSGALADRLRRIKPFVVIGYGLAGVARPLIGIATSWVGVLAFRFVDRVGKGLRSAPRDAMLAGSVSPQQRGLAYGLHRGMDNAGAVVGPLVAAALLAAGFSLRHVFLLAIVPGIIVLIMALRLREPAQAQVKSMGPIDWRFSALSPAYRRYLSALGLFTLGNASNMFLLLRAQDLGLGASRITLLWASFSAVAALASTPLSALSDRVGRKRLILAGWAGYALLYVLLGVVPIDAAWLWVLFPAYGLVTAMIEGSERALVADLVPATSAGTAFGWYYLVTGLLLLPASAVFGALWENGAPMIAFGVSAVFAIAASLVLMPLKAPTGEGDQ